MLFEHMARESLHPYHWVLKARRRERYYRVERGVAGFFVPEHVRSDTKTETLYDFKRLSAEWISHVHNNYYSDMTPSARRTVLPVRFPLEMILNYGIMRGEAWERYFMTGRDKGWYTQKEVAMVRDAKKFPYDLTTKEGKREFEN